MFPSIFRPYVPVDAAHFSTLHRKKRASEDAPQVEQETSDTSAE